MGSKRADSHKIDRKTLLKRTDSEEGGEAAGISSEVRGKG